jgi:Sulfotransferase domain
MNAYRASGLPSGLCIGPQRTGTSWLDQYLRWRGDVCLPRGVKETFYFDKYFSSGLDFYRSHFPPYPNHLQIIEVCPTYFDSDLACQRIKRTLGSDIRLLCTLRDPVDRTLSLYHHLRRYGQVSGTVREAVAANRRIVESSFYARHLEKWFAEFGRQTVKVAFLDDLQDAPEAWVMHVCEHLRLPFTGPPAELANKVNAAAKANVPHTIVRMIDRTAHFLRQHRLYGVINVAKAAGLKKLIFGRNLDGIAKYPEENMDRKWLYEILLPEIEQLEEVLGQKLNRWKY